MRRLLADRDLRRLFLGQLVSLLGDSMMLLVLGVWVKAITGSSALAGAVILLIVAPGLAAPLTGYVVDRVRRRRFLVFANLLSALAVLPLLAVGASGPLWILFAVALLYGVSFAFFSPGMSALLQAIVPKEGLAPANGLIQTVKQGLRLVGPLLGAGLYAAFGGATVAIIDAATFVVAAVCLWSMRTPDPVPEAMPSHFRGEVLAGLRHIRAAPVLLRTVATVAVSVLVVGFDEAVSFAIVDDGLHRPPAFLGVLGSTQGVGAIVGGITAATLIRRRAEPYALGLGLVAMAVGCALMAAPALVPVRAGVAIFGMGLTWVVVAFNTLIQTRTPGHLVGRTWAAADVAITAPQTLSIGIGALAVSVFDFRVLLVAEVVVLAACAVVLLRPHPSDAVDDRLAGPLIA
jgi:MFS family permease